MFYLATVNKGKPACRAIGFHELKEGKLYFGVGTFKDVYRQLQENPYAQICACHGAFFLRYSGRAVFEQEDAMEKTVFEKKPALAKIYQDNGHHLGIFHLEEASVEIHVMSKLKSTFTL
ncbi:pyridoxamine 5'-phosphate oxidase family protein [Erysipelotrichaceae bacterium RD49]|nr:pyridoxamine 5'-phosphate oxidase family protein [Erysipelotrichaceae bacterium RD49]